MSSFFCMDCNSHDCEHTRFRMDQRTASLNKKEPPMTDVRDIIRARGVTHGDYPTQALTADAIRQEIIHSLNYPAMTAVQRDALMMIAVKISRILNGDHTCGDSWLDIAGYATLAYDYLCDRTLTKQQDLS